MGDRMSADIPPLGESLFADITLEGLLSCMATLMGLVLKLEKQLMTDRKLSGILSNCLAGRNVVHTMIPCRSKHRQ